MEFKNWWRGEGVEMARNLRVDSLMGAAEIGFNAGREKYKGAFETAYKMLEKKDLEIRRQRLRIIDLINEVAEMQKKLDWKG